jgi:4-phospho-D-threonate 3-dehydrogenase / 4-phospho-D-erythronate 3-dehydrogenase
VKPVIGITMGDAAGVGPEVSLKAAASAAVNSCRTVVIGSAEVLKKRLKS